MQEIVEAEGIELLNNIRLNMFKTDSVATGQTKDSLRIEVKQEGTKTRMQVFGRPFFNTISTGRRPTPDKKPSREMISRITAWVEARDIDINAVWAIATNIQKKGTRLWQEGGRNDIVEPAIDTFVNNVSQRLLDEAATEFQIKIRSMEW